MCCKMNISPVSSSSWRKIKKLIIGLKTNMKYINMNTNAPEPLKHQAIQLF